MSHDKIIKMEHFCFPIQSAHVYHAVTHVHVDTLLVKKKKTVLKPHHLIWGKFKENV